MITSSSGLSTKVKAFAYLKKKKKFTCIEENVRIQIKGKYI